MSFLRIPSRAVPRASSLRLPLASAPSRFSSTTTTETTSAGPSDAPILQASASPAPPTGTNTPTSPTAAKPTLQSHNVRYFVARTASRQLPVYESKKRGGSLAQTKIRKVEGNVRALKDFIQSQLGVEDEKIRINPRNNHIDIKGKYKSQVEKLLESRGF